MKETKYWTFHILTGIALIFFLGFHFLYTHIGGLIFKESDNISRELSQARDAKVSFMIFFIVLLGLGLYHGLYGLKNILFEIFPGKSIQKAIAIVIIILGVCLFIFGSYSSHLAHKNVAIQKTEVGYVK